MIINFRIKNYHTQTIKYLKKINIKFLTDKKIQKVNFSKM